MTQIKNIIVFYIDVGQMPTEKAMDFLERQKECFDQETLDQLESQGNRVIWIPVRPNGGTTVEIIPVAHERSMIDKLNDVKLQVMSQNPQMLGEIFTKENDGEKN